MFFFSFENPNATPVTFRIIASTLSKCGLKVSSLPIVNSRSTMFSDPFFLILTSGVQWISKWKLVENILRWLPIFEWNRFLFNFQIIFRSINSNLNQVYNAITMLHKWWLYCPIPPWMKTFVRPFKRFPMTGDSLVETAECTRVRTSPLDNFAESHAVSYGWSICTIESSLPPRRWQ